MWFKQRSHEQEILDLGPEHYSIQEYSDCLTQLGRINQLLGGFAATKKAFFALKKVPKTILEVGCGGGLLCKNMSHWFPDAQISGIDINLNAIQIAKLLYTTDSVSFSLQKEKALNYANNQFDVVTAMLVCHHMEDEEIVEFLKECVRISSIGVIINDLQRHFISYISFSLIAPFAFPNRLIWHDGRLSIKRSFCKNDWIHILEKAGFHPNQYELCWNWAFRWTLTIKK